MRMPKTLSVRAVTGHFFMLQPPGTHLRYAGRKYDAKGDPHELEAEFPSTGEPATIPNDQRARAAVAAGLLEATDEATARVCGVKLATKTTNAKDAK